MAKINLVTFKKGDDFFSALGDSKGNVIEALKTQADVLHQDSQTIIRVASMIEGLPDDQKESVVVYGNGHDITISGPAVFMKMLKQLKLIE